MSAHPLILRSLPPSVTAMLDGSMSHFVSDGSESDGIIEDGAGTGAAESLTE